MQAEDTEVIPAPLKYNYQLIETAISELKTMGRYLNSNVLNDTIVNLEAVKRNLPPDYKQFILANLPTPEAPQEFYIDGTEWHVKLTIEVITNYNDPNIKKKWWNFFDR